MVLMLLTLAACGVNAQNDDMYFVPKKKSVKQATPRYEDDRQPAYYVGSSRDVDEYNRHSRLHSSYQVIEHNDSVETILLVLMVLARGILIPCLRIVLL